jgi:hypothetical protein
VPSSAERLTRPLLPALVMALALAGCSSDAPDGDAQPSASPSSSSSTRSSSTPTPTPTVTPTQVADLVEQSAQATASATVRIQVGTQCTVDGVATFGRAPSLVGRIDFRDSPGASDYVARDGRVEVTVPPGEPFPAPGPTSSANPWGPGLSRIDPGVVPLVIRDHATAVTVRATADGGVSYLVTLEGRATLVDFGSEPSADMPDSVSYEVELDAQGRFTRIHADFDDYGNDLVSFEDWT